MNVNNVARGFIPEIFDATIYRTLEDNLVLEQIAKAPLKTQESGDTRYFTDLGDATISDYTGTLTAEEIKDSQTMFTLDKTKTFCFKVQDVDSLMANVDVKGSQTQRAGYNLKDAVEKDVFRYVGDYANAGTALSGTITSANVISYVSELARMLYDNNVGDENLFMLVPPWMRIKLQLAGIVFEINNGINGKGGMQWSKDLGFTTYVTNTVYNSSTPAAPVSTILAGSYQAIGFDKRILKTRNIELSGSRGTQIDGGLVYGYKAIKTKELGKAVFTFGAETTI